MTDPGGGLGPVGPDQRTLGELVTEITEKTSLLIHEEIELAKAEIFGKLTKLGIGAAVGGAAGIFLVFGLIYGLIAVAEGIDSFGFSRWVGYAIVWLALTLIGAVAGFVAYRMLKKGSPPLPSMAIEEAKATRETFEEVRH